MREEVVTETGGTEQVFLKRLALKQKDIRHGTGSTKGSGADAEIFFPFLFFFFNWDNFEHGSSFPLFSLR